MAEVFDDWPDRYDRWFETPIGRLVRECEGRLRRELLAPEPGERILDVGCGTGVFTVDLLAAGAEVAGLERSLPMLRRLREKAVGLLFQSVQGDIRALPFPGAAFDKAISVTVVEFLADAAGAVAELFRATRPGGTIVVATLNALSPWAARRKIAAAEGHPIFQHVHFRSPEELAALAPNPPLLRTAVHFAKDEDADRARAVEAEGRAQELLTGALLVARWVKPHGPALAERGPL
ncbi:MAG: methyltransferase domain-containing protein [Deltaproteobacteria bacterium]|nr:methyltransferase domain-containing protein [Deltaproteobacteria bacterium]